MVDNLNLSKFGYHLRLWGAGRFQYQTGGILQTNFTCTGNIGIVLAPQYGVETTNGPTLPRE